MGEINKICGRNEADGEVTAGETENRNPEPGRESTWGEIEQRRGCHALLNPVHLGLGNTQWNEIRSET